ncbi:hypothetical protein ASE35_05350 [Lysobacter sp. Root916]|uniref:hypothetical protein n=1 Tax=Lysobacter sp. Root916 TaxID=1736606 RepID=UPI00070B6A83|nr:hypothetical protein [Lysobacter sp. Root916]KRD39750.1 hypothetical protein ASE35_05350 [Lysobacter sp. Root916]
MSIRLLLTQYLSSLRERDELDALLPELLVAMGHTVLSRPQLGAGQAGVDVVSTFAPTGDDDDAYMYIIKFGDIGRDDMYVGTQAIEPSVREAYTDFARNRLDPRLRERAKHLVVVTSGELKQTVQAGFSALAEDVQRQPGFKLELWDIDKLATLIEENLLNEALLLKAGRDHLRAAIATLEESEEASKHFRRFVDRAFDPADVRAAPSPAAKKRLLLKRFAAAQMGWGVFDIWGKSESNLRPSVEGAEYLLLRAWAEALAADLADDPAFLARFDGMKSQFRDALTRYFEKIWPQLIDQYVLMDHVGEGAFYNRLVLQEAGRLGLLLLLTPDEEENQGLRADLGVKIVALFNAHPGGRLPALDGRAVDLSIALAALMSVGDYKNVSLLAQDVASRFVVTARGDGRCTPVSTDRIEDALTLRDGDGRTEVLCRTTSLVPMLASVAAFAQADEALRVLREELHPLLGDVTKERWFPAAPIDQIAARPQDGLPGVSRALIALQGSCAEEAAASVTVPVGAAGASEVACVAKNQEELLVLSARHFRHPLPTWYMEQFRRPPLIAQEAAYPEPEVTPEA